MLFVNDHVMDRIKLYYIEFHIYFQRNKSKISRITDDQISYERNKGTGTNSSGNCAREQFIANQVKTGITGKRKGNSRVETRPSQLPRTITFPYALVPCIVSHVEPATKWWKTVRA